MNRNRQSSGDKLGIILTILLLIVGIGNLAFNIYFCKNYHLVSVIIGFIPFVIMVMRDIITILDKSGDFKPVNIATMGVIIFILFGDIVVIKALEYVTVTTDPGSYTKVLKSREYPINEYIAHFPKEIPEKAENVEFKEWTAIENKPGMILTYTLPRDEYEKINTKDMKDSSKYKAETEQDLAEIKDRKFIPDLVYNELGLQEDSEHKVEDFKVYFIDCSPIEEWNHGYSYGTILNKEDYKITYFKVKW